MWQNGIYSRADSGKKFIDSMKVKAISLEGMIYRTAGLGEPKIGYVFDKACVQDSIKMEIFAILGDFVSQSILVSHPRYKFKTNRDGYVSRNISCSDTSRITEDLKVISNTKEGKIIKVKNLVRLK